MSKKRFSLLNPSEHFESFQANAEQLIKWELCFICQEESSSPLTCPANSTSDRDGTRGYSTVIANLTNFKGIGKLPASLQVRIQRENLLQDLIQNKAKFHKSCRNSYDSYHYERACKRRKTEDLSEESLLSAPSTRSRFAAQNFTPTCFFCEEPETEVKLCNARTLGLDRRVREAARRLSDERLLAKLSEGDLVAIEARYHKTCLIALYNRLRVACSKSPADFEDDILYGVVVTEVVEYIRECITSSEDITPVFKLKELKSLVSRRLAEYNASQDSIDRIHSTRLKEDILKELPDLSEAKHGRDVLLTLGDDVGAAIFDACTLSGQRDGTCLAKAATIVRKQLFVDSQQHDGILQDFGENSAVPPSLFSLISMILGHSVLEDDVHERKSKAAVAISQLIRFNAVKKQKNRRTSKPETTRHLRKYETSFPLYTGLMLHSRTRKKGLVSALAEYGMSVSYNRVQDVELSVTKQLCRVYQTKGVVCPPTLQNGVFTTAAIDNIDHNPSSTTATDAFHGTSISIFQHPEEEQIEKVFTLDREIDKMNIPLELPESFTAIFPAKTLPSEYLLQQVCIQDIANDNDNSGFFMADEWLETIRNSNCAIEVADVNERISWSAFHARREQSTTIQPKSISTLLPLLKESVASTAMVRHTMKIVQLALQEVNPGQAAVVTGDQPVYALGKQVQWHYPDDYGEDKLVMMMGALHIEMNFLGAIGDWLEGSGWVDLLVKSSINTPGRAESMLKGNQVKRSRYVHQVSCATLYLLLTDTYVESPSKDVPFHQWIAERRSSSVQFHYWLTVIELEGLLLKLVRSLRESNFQMFVSVLLAIVPWMFALDHTHYSRWLPIFIQDMQMLEMKHPDIYSEFLKGHFTHKKTDRPFSCMAEDQAHEQNNKDVKTDGGAVGILDNESSLVKWMIGGPEIARLVRNFNSTEERETGEKKHHEDTDAFETKFRKDVRSFKQSFTEAGNPFSDEYDSLVQVMTRTIMNSSAADSVINAKNIGKVQYDQYVQKRLVTCEQSIYDAIPKNNLPIFRAKNTVSTSKGKLKMTSLKDDCKLYASLYVACQSRSGDLADFFAHENHSYPPSISEYGQLRKGTMSDFVNILESIGTTKEIPPTDVTAKVFDGAAIVQMVKSQAAKTYGEYSKTVFWPFILNSKDGSFSRIDVVFDVYTEGSLKAETRERRGRGVRIAVKESTPVWKNWQQFLKVEENKSELFHLLAQDLVNCPAVQGFEGVILATDTEEVVSTGHVDINHNELRPCNHEEADTRILLHVKHAADSGHRKIAIRTVDTDVLVLAVSFFHQLNIDELWVEFGVGRNKRWLPAHEYATSLGRSVCGGLRFWFAFTGCDTVSAFCGKGKKSCWNIWKSFPEVTETFSR